MTFREFKIHLKHKINKLTEEYEDRSEVSEFFLNNQIEFGDNNINKEKYNNIFGHDKRTKLRANKQSTEYLLKSMDVPLSGEERARLVVLYINKYLKRDSVKDKENLTYNELRILEELINEEERDKNKRNKN